MIADKWCPVCISSTQLQARGDAYFVPCPRCGPFVITGTAVSGLVEVPLTPGEQASISGWIAETKPEVIGFDELSRLRLLVKTRPLRTVSERMDLLLMALASTPGVLGAAIDVQSDAPRYIGRSYSQNEGELRYLIEQLERKGWVACRGTWRCPIVLPEGYARIDEISAKNPASPIGFCAMWFNEEVRPLWTEVIEPAIAEAGFDPKRVDSVEHNNRIDEEIVTWLRRARFVVADLTAHRPGVYFEAGFALGQGIPVVWMVRKDDLDNTHFDNRQYNFITWTPDRLGDTKQRLRFRIEATIGRGPRSLAA